MNYYERIQKSIDYIEANLDQEITIEECAREAFMSISGYYRFFLSIVGYSIKEYIRLRRLSLALADMQEHRELSVMTIATKYDYNSADSFSRAFKKQFGILPSQIKTESSKQIQQQFERINIMEKYFEMDDQELLDKYPDIKIIRELDDMKVACFTYFGPNPEDNAFKELQKWVCENQISLHDSAYRIFGYNNPDPSDPADGNELYGYEVCVTIPDSLFDSLEDVPGGFVKGTYDSVKRKVLQGGRYAVLSVKRDATGDIGMNIMYAWQRFMKWLNESKYIWGGRQYLEEHLGFSEEDDHIGGVELYMPIEKASSATGEKQEEIIEPCRVAIFRSEGEDGDKAAQDCWKKVLDFAQENQLDSKQCRIFQYNKGFDRRPPFFHVVMISLPENFDEKKNENINFEEFTGGKYMSTKTDCANLMNTWMQMEQWRKEAKIAVGNHQWVEEWFWEGWKYPCKQITVYYPI